MIINSWPNKVFLGYSFKEQIIDIFPGIFLAVLMGNIILLANLLMLSDTIKLVLQITLGTAIYVGLSAILKVDSFEYLWDMIKSILKK